jgi:hypothetical protein
VAFEHEEIDVADQHPAGRPKVPDREGMVGEPGDEDPKPIKRNALISAPSTSMYQVQRYALYREEVSREATTTVRQRGREQGQED